MIHQKPEISIILPVYNVEKQLEKCLNSISRQVFSGTFEIIACEAFSTDNSLAILKSFQIKEPRLRIIEHGFREELSTSRMTGFNASTGDYIMHLDSDDWLLPGALEKLYQTCRETDADVVVFDYVTEDINGKRSSSKHIKEKIITTDKFIVQNHFYGACWNKIVRRVLNENMVYSEIGVTNTEDLPYSLEVLLKAEKICLLPEPFYVYFVNTESSSYTTNWEQYLNNQIFILNQIQKIVTKYNVELRFTENVLDYFEKWVYLQLARIHFWQREKLTNCSKMVRELFLYQIMSKDRIARLEFSIESKYTCLFELIDRLGLKIGAGIIFRSIVKK